MESKRIELKLPNGKDYLSYSSAKHLASHPLSYLSYIADKFEPNEGMIFGIFYEALLYSDTETLEKFYIYDEEAIVRRAIEKYGKETKSIRSTNVYKDIKEEALLEAKNYQYTITEEQNDIAQKMGVIMQDSGIFDKYLNGETQKISKSEIDTGKYIVKVLAKKDVTHADGSVVDLKTTSSVISAFPFQAKKIDYDLQAYIAMEADGLDEFTFVTQRTEGLNDIGIFTVERDSKFFDSGRYKLNKAVDNYIDWLSPEAQMVEANPSHYIHRQVLY